MGDVPKSEVPEFLVPQEGDGQLVAHAKKELAIAGVGEPDADYGGMTAKAVLELIQTFSAQGHSGMSAIIVLGMFYRIAQFKPLTALTTDPDEWMEVTNEILPPEAIKAGHRKWQSRRHPSVFSEDGGKTYKDLETNEMGESISPEEARDASKTEQSQQEAPGGAREIPGSGPAQAGEGLQTQPATEPGDAPAPDGGSQPGGVEDGERQLEGEKRPDSSQPPQTGTQSKKTNRSSRKKGGKKGGQK